MKLRVNNAVEFDGQTCGLPRLTQNVRNTYMFLPLYKSKIILPYNCGKDNTSAMLRDIKSALASYKNVQHSGQKISFESKYANFGKIRDAPIHQGEIVIEKNNDKLVVQHTVKLNAVYFLVPTLFLVGTAIYDHDLSALSASIYVFIICSF